MSDIFKIKHIEMQGILDFYDHVQEYDYVFYDEESTLNPPFKNIMEGIIQIKKEIEFRELCLSLKSVFDIKLRQNENYEIRSI